MRATPLIILALALPLAAAPALADSLRGNCVNKAGEPCDHKVHTISTSWNGKKAFPDNGAYFLDFGGTVGTTITVYCDGDKVGTVRVKGDTSFNVRCR